LRLVSLAKIESAPFAEHIADVHGLNLNRMPIINSAESKVLRMPSTINKD